MRVVTFTPHPWPKCTPLARDTLRQCPASQPTPSLEAHSQWLRAPTAPVAMLTQLVDEVLRARTAMGTTIAPPPIMAWPRHQRPHGHGQFPRNAAAAAAADLLHVLLPGITNERSLRTDVSARMAACQWCVGTCRHGCWGREASPSATSSQAWIVTTTRRCLLGRLWSSHL